MDKPAAASTRLHLANERTLLAWTKLASIIGAGGFLNRLLLPLQLLVDKDHALRSMQTAHLSLAFIVLALGLHLFCRRRSLLGAKWLGSYSAWATPWVASMGVLATLLATLYQAIQREVEYYSPGCLMLKRPLVDAPPPN